MQWFCKSEWVDCKAIQFLMFGKEQINWESEIANEELRFVNHCRNCLKPEVDCKN
jgi:hypothetical protein